MLSLEYVCFGVIPKLLKKVYSYHGQEQFPPCSSLSDVLQGPK